MLCRGVMCVSETCKAEEGERKEEQEEAQRQREVFARDEERARAELEDYAGGHGIARRKYRNGGYTYRTTYKMVRYALDLYENEKDETEKLRKEIDKLEAHIAKIDGDDGYRRWKKAQRNGREKKQIDWERYDKLKGVGLTEKDAAKYLGVSVSTLRTRLKERQGQGV